MGREGSSECDKALKETAESVVDHAASDGGNWGFRLEDGQYIKARMIGHSLDSARKYESEKFRFGADQNPHKFDVRFDECGVHGRPRHVHDILH